MFEHLLFVPESGRTSWSDSLGGFMRPHKAKPQPVGHHPQASPNSSFTTWLYKCPRCQEAGLLAGQSLECGRRDCITGFLIKKHSFQLLEWCLERTVWKMIQFNKKTKLNSCILASVKTSGLGHIYGETNMLSVFGFLKAFFCQSYWITFNINFRKQSFLLGI